MDINLINGLSKVLQNSKVTVIRTVSGAGAPLTIKNVIQNLRLNTFFVIESPDWFDFKVLDSYYANNNTDTRDLFVFVLDRGSCPTPFSYKEVRKLFNQNYNALIITNGIELVDTEKEDVFTLIDFRGINDVKIKEPIMKG